MSKNCPWWMRWYRRRLRKIDDDLFLGHLRRRVADRGAMKKVESVFARMPGQEHWHCACAKRDALLRNCGVRE